MSPSTLRAQKVSTSSRSLAGSSAEEPLSTREPCLIATSSTALLTPE
jgi:hypothetical protein